MKQADLKKVKLLDFRKPDRLTQENIQIINGVFAKFCEHCSTFFSQKFMVETIFNPAMIRQAPFSNCLDLKLKNIILAILSMKPYGDIVLQIENNLSFTLIDILLGGQGRAQKTERNLTEIDVSLLTFFISSISELLNQAWMEYKVDCKLLRIETNPNTLLFSSLQEMSLNIVLKVNVGDIESSMNIAMPFPSIEQLIPKLGNSYKYELLSTKTIVTSDILVEEKKIFGFKSDLNDFEELQFLQKEKDYEIEFFHTAKTIYTAI